MIDPCPNINCTSYQKNNFVIKDGTYFRCEDSRKINRFKCKLCNRRFSSSTKTLECWQKKRRVNFLLFQILASGISMRRSAKILNINRRTVDRKLIYLAMKSRLNNHHFLQQLKKSPVTNIQFDDLISSIHTKLRPVSVSIAVDKSTRIILGVEVGEIPAFGHLAAISKSKYGKRKNEHLEKLNNLFLKIKEFVSVDVKIESDEHQNYLPMILKHFPNSKYRQYKGARGSIVGQGELKKLNYDPLFKINHTLAMFRANINRLIRRTWCTSKNIERLKDHIDIYIEYHNQNLK